MSQWPRWARKQMLEDKLKDVIRNPYSDVASVSAAKEAIERKLDEQDREYRDRQESLTQSYMKKLSNLRLYK